MNTLDIGELDPNICPICQLDIDEDCLCL